MFTDKLHSKRERILVIFTIYFFLKKQTISTEISTKKEMNSCPIHASKNKDQGPP